MQISANVTEGYPCRTSFKIMAVYECQKYRRQGLSTGLRGDQGSKDAETSRRVLAPNKRPKEP